MSRRLVRRVHIVALLMALAAPALGAAEPTPTSDRFFLAFAEDAALVKSQWWEGTLAYTDHDRVDSMVLRGVAAFQPWKGVELGGRVGFGTTDTEDPLFEGSGATDLDLWGKYNFGTVFSGAEVAAGALVTVPTGDDTAGLGGDAFDLGIFGSLRRTGSRTIWGVQAGLRLNGDGSVAGASYSGDTSLFLGGGVIFPLSDSVRLVGEARMESARVDGGDSDARLLVGIDWRPFRQGMIRGAAAAGLTDGAPNGEVSVGYAWAF